MWTSTKKKKSQTHRNRVEWWLPGAGSWGEGEYVGQRVQISGYKMNKLWRSSIQHVDYS